MASRRELKKNVNYIAGEVDVYKRQVVINLKTYTTGNGWGCR